MSTFSVVIPHYNSLDSLPRLLGSIPDENFIEIILVDDNSDDQITPEKYLSKFVNAKVNFFRNTTQNKGAGACRNIGLYHSNGRFIVFADSDDYFIEDSFFVMLDELKLSPYKELILFKPTSRCDLTNNISDRHLLYCNIINNYNDDKNILYDFVVPWSKVISKKLITENNIKFDEEIASNDVMFSMKVCLHAKDIQVSTSTIYCVTRNVGSLTVTKSKKVIAARFRVEKNRIEFVIKNNIDVKTNSFLGMIKNYHQAGIFTVTKDSFLLFLKGRIDFISRRYLSFLFNPRKLINFIKSKNSINDRKYKNKQ